jgi:hypothetical protein
MPWKETSPLEERLRFVAGLLEGEPMTALRHEFGICRTTGYKILVCVMDAWNGRRTLNVFA